MRNLKSAVLGTALLLVLSGLVVALSDKAQHTVQMTVQEICVLDVTTANVALEIVAPGLGGDTPSNDTDNTSYLQYTSTVGSGKARSITAAWQAGDAAPAGCSLLLEATPQGGNRGSSAGQKTISSSAENIVTGVKSCATGRGANQGAQLTYTLSVDDVENLIAGDTKTATITFTLTDAV